MRQIGTLPEEQALTLSDHLLTLGITSRLIRASDGYGVWIHREEHVERARQELESFRQDPEAPQYRGAGQQAEQIRRRQDEVEREHRRKTIDLRGRAVAGIGPITRGLVIACVIVFLAQIGGFTIAGRPIEFWLFFSVWGRLPDGTGVNLGLAPILSGQLWRLITPIFGHGSLLHIFFNMYMLVLLGGGIERRRSRGEFATLILVAALVSNVAQFYLPDLFTVPGRRVEDAPFLGMSGVIYGLFGFAWIRGRYDPASGLTLHPQTVTLLLFWLVICAFNIGVTVANTAHVAGMLAGIAFALATLRRDGFRW